LASATACESKVSTKVPRRSNVKTNPKDAAKTGNEDYKVSPKKIRNLFNTKKDEFYNGPEKTVLQGHGG